MAQLRPVASISLVPVLALTLADTLALQSACCTVQTCADGAVEVVQFILHAFHISTSHYLTKNRSDSPNEKTPAGYKKKSAQNSPL